MFKQKELPFDDVTKNPQEKSVPRKTDEFLQHIEFLASSPQIDLSFIGPYIIQFLKLPRLKNEAKKFVYFAIRDLLLPDDFWVDFIQMHKSDLNINNPCAEGLIISLSNAPVSVILSEMNNFSFLDPFYTSNDPNLKYAGFYTFYAFMGYIKISPAIVQSTLYQLNSKAPKLIFICLKIIQFLISIDYPNINDLLKPYHNYIMNTAYVHGHLLNISLLELIINIIKPDIQQLLSLLPHVSLSSRAYILSKIPTLPNFSHISDIPPSSIIPEIVSIINHPFSDGMRTNLVISALKIIEKAHSHRYFDHMLEYLYTTDYPYGLDVVSQLVYVASTFNELSRIIAKGNEAVKQKEFFTDLCAVSALVASQTNTDILAELFKLLLSQNEQNRHWVLAASAVASYMWHQKANISSKVQTIFELSKTVKNPSIRALLLLYISEFVPPHLQANLLKCMKEVLFPNNSATSEPINLKFTTTAENQIPLLLQVALVYAMVVKLGFFDEIDELKEEMSDPLFQLAVAQGKAQMANTMNMRRVQRRPSFLDAKLQANSSELPPASPFICCSVIDLGLLASSLCPQSLTTNLTVNRDFVEISPVYHAMTIEIASIVDPIQRSICLDLRVSTKGVVPSVTITLDVPITLSLPQVPEWIIKGLQEGTKVTHRFSFTAEKLDNPFAMISVIQENVHVLDIKVCLPLIDTFRKIEPPKELMVCMWDKLRYQRENIDLPDAMWTSQFGCIAVRNGVARSNSEQFLDMLPSAFKTCSVVN
ncbi:hypothetical protein GPJ56_009035 [Histomonas meleagridis]|uniref:uncharacterized protein n=1 Tax=Histomonas meleagridis TaxID=135588 RepID=UPI0035594F2B|nr:hypothetical protein GPJ56_009035 [Histomonas meleagridis]KAH0799310.1 hypothetical protein GO595_008107 [Histomonas meleagridis]